MQEPDNKVLIKSHEICSVSMVKRVAAMLDLDTQAFSEGDILPIGWHFFMLAGETLKSALRSDGFPGLGVPIPPEYSEGLPRLLLGGRTVSYQGDIVIGSQIERTSFIKNITEKTTNSGRMAIVMIQHELRPIYSSNPAIVETQTYILLEAQSGSSKTSKDVAVQRLQGKYKEFIPDETLLFQYSALGFNSHKIHLDRNYAQNVEGLPDLVVNGGLATLLLTEFMRVDLGLKITEIKVKHVAPLFCGRKMTLYVIASDSAATEGGETNGQFKIFDENNNVAVEMTVETLQCNVSTIK
jgi:3-methylfumaryl-CoA hydratase